MINSHYGKFTYSHYGKERFVHIHKENALHKCRIQLNLALDYQALEARAHFLVALCLGFKARLGAQSMKGL